MRIETSNSAYVMYICIDIFNLLFRLNTHEEEEEEENSRSASTFAYRKFDVVRL